MPTPDVLGRNGTYVVFRKLHTRVAAYRQYLAGPGRRAGPTRRLLGAKMVGRWQSGAPLALSPDGDDPALGERPATRNNDFGYGETRAASSARSAPTPAERTRGTPSTTTAASTCASTG